MTKYNERLKYFFECTQDDLHANQGGYLTEHQVAILQKAQRLYGFLLIVLSLALIISIVIVCVGLRLDPLGRSVVGVFIALVLAVLSYVGKKFIDYQKDIKQRIVKRRCGQISLAVRPTMFFRRLGLLVYELIMEGGPFVIPRDQFMALRAGEYYCMSYALNSRKVLAAEHVDIESFTLCENPAVSVRLTQQGFGAHAQSRVADLAHTLSMDLDRLLEIAQPCADWHVLDVATGEGYTVLKFAPHVGRVVAGDLIPQRLKAAQAHITGKGVRNVEFQVADAENLPFAGNTFDLVTCRIASHHFDNAAGTTVEQFVKEAARVIKPGGLLLVQELLMPEDPLLRDYVELFEKLRDSSYKRAFTETEWRAAFEEAGLTLENIEIVVKSYRFEEWTMIKDVPLSTKARLEAMIDVAPPAVIAWLQPRDFGTPEATFVNYHIILAGRKSEWVNG